MYIFPDALSVRECVERAWHTRMYAFYPSILTKQFGLTFQEVIKELEELAEEGLIKFEYEVNCPECFRTIEVNKSRLKELTGYECITCGEVQIDPNMLNIRCRLIKG